MKMIHKRTEGERVYDGINYMVTPGYIGVYIRIRGYTLKLRIRSKAYALLCEGGKRIYFKLHKDPPSINGCI